MNYKIIIILLLSSLSLLQFCKKKENYVKPEIEIFTPVQNASFNLPGTMLVEFSVKSINDIKFIRLSVDDSEYKSVFTQKFFYPEENEVAITYDFQMSYLVDQSSEPYFLHIAVDDGVALTHKYLQIQLVNAKRVLKGFYLFAKSSVNQTHVKYFDTAYQENDFTLIDGDYVDAEVSEKSDMLFIATAVPGKLYGYESENQTLKWTQQPEAPYPDYTDLYHDGTYLYVGYANERIAALSETSGMQKVGTKILVDSVPLKIGVSGNFFIGDFKSRTSSSRSWEVFYRISGYKYQSYETAISVVDFYPSSYDDALDVYGNVNGDGVMLKYYYEPNESNKKKSIPLGLITNTCRTDSWRYLISIGNKIYQSSIEGGYTNLYIDYPGEIIDLDFDPVYNLIFCLREYQLEVYSYPDVQLLKTIESDKTLKAIKLRYGY